MGSTRTTISVAAIGMLVLFQATPSWSLSFDDITTKLDSFLSVREARLELQAAEQQFGIASLLGNPELTLLPSITNISEEGESFGQQTDLAASISGEIPVGFSPERGAAAATAKDTLLRARENLVNIRGEVYFSLFRLYQGAWLAQRETEVLQAELVAAREQERVVRLLFERGETSVSALNTAEDDLSSAETSFTAGTLKKRISWLELAYAADLNPNREEPLKEPEPQFPDLPRPPELTLWAHAHSPVLRYYQDQISAFEREIKALRGSVIPPTLRTSFSGWDQSASASFNLDNPAVGLSYSFPIATLGTDVESTASGSGKDDDTWQVGISVSVPIQGRETGRREADLLRSRIAQTEVQLALIKDTTALQIRSHYQQYVLSADTVEQSRRSIELARMTLETVLSRRQTQRATLAEELLARSQLERALFRYDQAVANRQEAKLLAAQAASWLDQLLFPSSLNQFR